MQEYDFRKRGWWSGRTRIKQRPLDDALIAICEATPPRRYLEIGTREGGSLTAVLRFSRPQPDLIVCCDTWGRALGGTGRGSHAHIDRLMDAEGYAGERRFLDGRSQDLIPRLRLRNFDVVLVDGDHREGPAREDVANTWPLVRPGGLLVLDDTNAAHIRRILNDLLAAADATLLWRGDYRPGCAVIVKEEMAAVGDDAGEMDDGEDPGETSTEE